MKFDKSVAYKREIMKSSALAQRALLLGVGLVYGVAGTWATIDAGTPLFLSTASFALLILTLAILDLSFSRNMTARIDAVPFLTALVFGVYTIMTMAGGSGDDAVLFALSFALFGFFVVALHHNYAALS